MMNLPICMWNPSVGSALSEVYPEATVYPRFYPLQSSWNCHEQAGTQEADTQRRMYVGEILQWKRWIRKGWSSTERRAYLGNIKKGWWWVLYTVAGTIYWRCSQRSKVSGFVWLDVILSFSLSVSLSLFKKKSPCVTVEPTCLFCPPWMLRFTFVSIHRCGLRFVFLLLCGGIKTFFLPT